MRAAGAGAGGLSTLLEIPRWGRWGLTLSW